MAAEEQSSANPSNQAEPGNQADTSTEADPNADDVKSKFRDALERKRNQHADGVGASGPGSSKIQDVHSRAGGKRQFRRKSGG